MFCWIFLFCFLSFFFATSNAAFNNNTKIYSGPSLNINIYDSSYSSNVILFCNDFETPATAVSNVQRQFYFNEGSLPNNTLTKHLDSQQQKASISVNHPTINNSGNYDCCVKIIGGSGGVQGNGTTNTTTDSAGEICYRTILIVTEYAHFPVAENNGNIEISLNRNNFLAIFDNSNVTTVACKQNGSELQSNVKPLYANSTNTPYFQIFNQLVFFETNTKNLGSYTCNGMDSNGQALTKNFTLIEAATRIYPWDGKNGETSDPTDTDGDGGNSAKTIYGNVFISSFIVFILSFIFVF